MRVGPSLVELVTYRRDLREISPSLPCEINKKTAICNSEEGLHQNLAIMAS
jgi:hypothetical protein